MEYDALDLSLRNISLFLFTLMALTESVYQIKRSFFADDRNWRHTMYPAVIGIIIAATFFPTTYFTYMPFAPWGFLGVVYTGLLAGRVANGGHAAYDKFGDLFQGWIGRVGRKY